MNLTIRSAEPSDIEKCSGIILKGFKEVSDKHGVSCDIPSLEVANQLTRFCINEPSVFSIVAELNGSVVGSNFLDERNPIRGVGPLSVDPSFQSKGIGRRLMETVLERGRDALGVRLVLDASNTVAISLYTSLGFEVKESLMLMAGTPKSVPPAEENNLVQPLALQDLDQCEALCFSVNGFERTSELRIALAFFSPMALKQDNRITAYSSAMTFGMTNHCVADNEQNIKDLILGAAQLTQQPLYFQMPTRHSPLFQWCLQKGFRAIKPLTLMALGPYQVPKGVYFPSLSF